MTSPAGHALLLQQPEPHTVLTALLLLCLQPALHRAACVPDHRPI
ncbi:hypothetical protein [Streptomyces glaucus]